MQISIYIVILLIINAYGECCNGKIGYAINSIDWSRYVFNVKAQGLIPSCWAQTTASFIEMMYYKKTGLRFELSGEQIFKHTYEQNLDLLACSPKTDLSFGGHPTCGLQYVGIRGIMTSFDYNYGGYDVRNTLPIGISNVYRTGAGSVDDAFDMLLRQLNSTPVITSFIGDDIKFIEDEITTWGNVYHAVIVTNICNNSGNYYMEYLNSYGKNWGKCGGFGYMRISNGTKIINNRYALNEIITGDVVDLRLTPRSYTYNNNKIDAVYNYVHILIGFIIFVTIISIILVSILVYLLKKNADNVTMLY